MQILKQWNIYLGRQWQHKPQEYKIVPNDDFRKKTRQNTGRHTLRKQNEERQITQSRQITKL